MRHKWRHAILFSYEIVIIYSDNRTYGAYFGLKHGLKRFQRIQYLIDGRYLGVAMNGLFML